MALKEEETMNRKRARMIGLAMLSSLWIIIVAGCAAPAAMPM
jgi:hypothetical protein